MKGNAPAGSGAMFLVFCTSFALLCLKRLLLDRRDSSNSATKMVERMSMLFTEMNGSFFERFES